MSPFMKCLFQFFPDLLKVIGIVRPAAVYAGFHAVLHDIVSPAVFSQMIQGTITEEAVETVFSYPFMAREILAFPVIEKCG